MERPLFRVEALSVSSGVKRSFPTTYWIIADIYRVLCSVHHLLLHFKEDKVSSSNEELRFESFDCKPGAFPTHPLCLPMAARAFSGSSLAFQLRQDVIFSLPGSCLFHRPLLTFTRGSSLGFPRTIYSGVSLDCIPAKALLHLRIDCD